MLLRKRRFRYRRVFLEACTPTKRWEGAADRLAPARGMRLLSYSKTGSKLVGGAGGHLQTIAGKLLKNPVEELSNILAYLEAEGVIVKSEILTILMLF